MLKRKNKYLLRIAKTLLLDKSGCLIKKKLAELQIQEFFNKINCSKCVPALIQYNQGIPIPVPSL